MVPTTGARSVIEEIEKAARIVLEIETKLPPVAEDLLTGRIELGIEGLAVVHLLDGQPVFESPFSRERLAPHRCFRPGPESLPRARSANEREDE